MNIEEIFHEGRITQRGAQCLHAEGAILNGITDPDEIIADYQRKSTNHWNCPVEEFDDDDSYAEHLASIVEKFMIETLKLTKPIP